VRYIQHVTQCEGSNFICRIGDRRGGVKFTDEQVIELEALEKEGVDHERMPGLLTNERDFETWLSGLPEEAFALARSYDPNAMRLVQSGMDKEDLLGRPGAVDRSRSLF
jgi:hypothetical protein